jgi:hypothetical protein
MDLGKIEPGHGALSKILGKPYGYPRRIAPSSIFRNMKVPTENAQKNKYASQYRKDGFVHVR